MPFANTTLSTIADPYDVFVAEPILILFDESRSALWHAMRLLGGYDACRLVDRCALLLEEDRLVSGKAWTLLERILSILSLEMTDDPERPYMGFFAVIDPSDPVVDEICLLTDRLGDAMAQAVERRALASRSQPRDAAARESTTGRCGRGGRLTTTGSA